MVAGSWILALICALPVTFFTTIKEIDGLPQCWIDLDNFGWRIYLIYLTSLLLILPTLIIAICYIHIVYTIWTKARLVNDQQQKRHCQQSASGAERIAESSRMSSLASRATTTATKDSDITMISIKQTSGANLAAAAARKSCLKSASGRHNGGEDFTIEQDRTAADQIKSTNELSHQQQVKFSSKTRTILKDKNKDDEDNDNDAVASTAVGVDLYQEIIGDSSRWQSKSNGSRGIDLDKDKVRNSCQDVSDVQMIVGSSNDNR